MSSPSTQSLRPHQIDEIRDIATCAICLELYEGARLLSCSHSFCFNCLWALCEETHYVRSRCPQCRESSIPPQSKLIELQDHTFVNQLSELVREQEKDGEEEDKESCCEDELYVGELLPPSLSEQESRESKPSKTTKLAMNFLKGAATVASLGITGFYFKRQARRKRRIREQLLAQDPNESFTCSVCQVNQKYCDSELRFKCGMCEDVSVCLSCATNPSSVPTHRLDHLLIKLKFKQKRELPSGCLLKYRKARDMSEELDFNSNIHGKTYYHTPEKIEWVDGISCGFCGECPIIGTRYKCGMCKDYDLCEGCEAHSESIHDPQHVFLVFRYHAKVNVVSDFLVKALIY